MLSEKESVLMYFVKKIFKLSSQAIASSLNILIKDGICQ